MEEKCRQQEVILRYLGLLGNEGGKKTGERKRGRKQKGLYFLSSTPPNSPGLKNPRLFTVLRMGGGFSPSQLFYCGISWGLTKLLVFQPSEDQGRVTVSHSAYWRLFQAWPFSFADRSGRTISFESINGSLTNSIRIAHFYKRKGKEEGCKKLPPPPGGGGFLFSDSSFLSDSPFDFLTYHLDGRVVACHGYNG